MKLLSRILPSIGLAGMLAGIFTGAVLLGQANVGLAEGLVLQGQTPILQVSRTSTLAALNTPPDKGTLYTGTKASFKALSVSADGRIVAGLDNNSSVWIFDAYNTATFDSSDISAKVALSGCTDPVGVYVGSTGVVHVPCAGGSVVQFKVSDNTTTTSLAPFTVSSAEPLTTGMSAITAAVLDDTGSTLYLAGATTNTTVPQVYTLKATSSGTAPTVFGSISNSSTTIKKLAVQESGALLAADVGGNLYALSSGQASSGLGVSCSGAAPSDLRIINSALAVMVSSASAKVYAIELLSSQPSTCTSYDWGLVSNPSAVAEVETATGSYLYIRGKTSVGSKVAVYPLTSVEQDYTGLTPSAEYVIDTGSTAGLADPMVSSGSLGLVFIGTAEGLEVLRSGPALKLTGLTTPPVLTEEAATASLTLTSDEAAENNWYDLKKPSSSSVSGTAELGATLVADTATAVEVDFGALALTAGLNTVYLYAKDSDGNLGFTAMRVNYVSVPAVLEDFDVRFGDEKLYLYFTAPDDETIDGYEVLIHYEAFEAPDASSLPDGWTDSTPNFTVQDVTYPGTSGWPMALNESTDSEVWSTDEDGRLVYKVMPLQNGVTYYVTIRATASGIGGDWAVVKSGTPEETCGAVCISDDVGGFCSYAPGATSRTGRSAWTVGLMAALVGMRLWSRGRRTQS